MGIEIAFVTFAILALGERIALLIVYFGPLLYLVFRLYGMPSLFSRLHVSGGRR